MSDEASTSATSQPKAKKNKIDELDADFPDNSSESKLSPKAV